MQKPKNGNCLKLNIILFAFKLYWWTICHLVTYNLGESSAMWWHNLGESSPMWWHRVIWLTADKMMCLQYCQYNVLLTRPCYDCAGVTNFGSICCFNLSEFCAPPPCSFWTWKECWLFASRFGLVLMCVGVLWCLLALCSHSSSTP